MLLATDTDLARIDPNLHTEILWFSQRLIKATGAISGTTLTISAFDSNFDAAQLTPGMIIVVGGIPHEVIAKLSATTAQISRIRPTSDDPLLTPAGTTGAEVLLSTFKPQLAVISEQVLRTIGLDPLQPEYDWDGSPMPALSNPASLRRFTSLWTLATIYIGAASMHGSDSPIAQRATRFRTLLAEERRFLAAAIDTDADGIADAMRRPGVIPLLRV